MKDTFTEIYKNKKWQDNYGTESGPGSSIECSRPYLEFINSYCDSNNIISILDVGCGDFNLMRHFDFENKKYLGIDIVSHVIESNTQHYQKENVFFINGSIINFDFKQKFDLILIKDVFQHFNDKTIKIILNNIKLSQCNNILITNDYSDNCNLIIDDGQYSPIDLLKEPYNANGEFVFEWQSCYFFKKVFKYII